MGRISAEIVGEKLIVTKYESDGYIIPDKISQNKKVISIINGNLDTDSDKEVKEDVDLSLVAVSREEFLVTLLSQNEECVSRYNNYGKGLYSAEDMKKGITWAEVAYLVHYVGGLPCSIDWNNIQPRRTDRVCVLHEIVYGKKRLDEKLSSYKNRLDMEYYIKCIVFGKRYIPLPVYCSFVDLLNNPGLETSLDLDMMFKKLSKKEFETLF